MTHDNQDNGAEEKAAIGIREKYKHFWINGTSTARSYLAFARSGTVILAIKVGPPCDGGAMGVSGTTFVGGRLRSTKITPEIKEHFETGNEVTSLADAKVWSNYHEPWPAVQFDKVRDYYASTSVGTFLRGSVKAQDPEPILAQFEDGSVSVKFADYLIKLAGGEKMLIIPRDELIQFFDEYYKPRAKAMRQSIQMHEEIQQHVEDNLGVFDMQGALMKKLYKEKVGDDDPEVTKAMKEDEAQALGIDQQDHAKHMDVHDPDVDDEGMDDDHDGGAEHQEGDDDDLDPKGKEDPEDFQKSHDDI